MSSSVCQMERAKGGELKAGGNNLTPFSSPLFICSQGEGVVKRVKLVRIAQGYTSYKFAALVGVHPNWWHEIEMGTRKPSEKVILTYWGKAAKLQ